MHGHNRTSVKEQIQLTKVFIAAEKENRFNPGWIHPSSFALHNEFQLGENSLRWGTRHRNGKGDNNGFVMVYDTADGAQYLATECHQG
eukprot:Em0001g2109a